MALTDIDQWLHDADRAVMGARMALQMRDRAVARELSDKAFRLYTQALESDPDLVDAAWQETGNRDRKWLALNELTRVPSDAAEGKTPCR